MSTVTVINSDAINPLGSGGSSANVDTGAIVSTVTSDIVDYINSEIVPTIPSQTLQTVLPNNFSENGYILANFGTSSGSATYDMSTSGLITVHWTNHGLTSAQNGAGITLFTPENVTRSESAPLGGIQLRFKWYEFASNFTYVDANTFTCQATITPLPLSQNVSGVSLGSSADALYNPIAVLPINIPANSMGKNGQAEVQATLYSPNHTYNGPYLVPGWGTPSTGFDKFVRNVFDVVEGGMAVGGNLRYILNGLGTGGKITTVVFTVDNCNNTSIQQPAFKNSTSQYTSGTESRSFVNTTNQTCLYLGIVPNGTSITGNSTLIFRSLKVKIFKSE